MSLLSTESLSEAIHDGVAVVPAFAVPEAVDVVVAVDDAAEPVEVVEGAAAADTKPPRPKPLSVADALLGPTCGAMEERSPGPKSSENQSPDADS